MRGCVRVAWATHALVVICGSLTAGCVLMAPSENARAQRCRNRGLNYNLRGIRNRCDPDRRDDHVVALGWLRDRRAVEPLLGVLDEGPSSGVFESVLHSLECITGVRPAGDRRGSSAAWQKWLRGERPPAVSTGYYALADFFQGPIIGIAGPTSHTSNEEAELLWHEWWSGHRPEAWTRFLTERLWAKHEPELLETVGPYVHWVDNDFGLELDDDAALCGVPHEKWLGLSVGDRRKLLTQRLKGLGISRERWVDRKPWHENREFRRDVIARNYDLGKLLPLKDVPAMPAQQPVDGPEAEKKARNDAADDSK